MIEPWVLATRPIGCRKKVVHSITDGYTKLRWEAAVKLHTERERFPPHNTTPPAVSASVGSSALRLHSMQFASNCAFADIQNETEPIFDDEIRDGIAHAAKEQAETWQLAAEEDGVDSQFVKDLVALTTKEMDKKREGVARAGELGTRSRLQPRYKKGAEAQYDAVCQNRIGREVVTATAYKLSAMAAQDEAEREAESYLKSLGVDSLDASNAVSLQALMGGGNAEETEVEEETPVVLCPGSSCFQAGFAGDDAPRTHFPSKVGR